MSRLRYNGLATGSSGSLTALTLGGSLTSSGTTITFSAALTYGNGTAVPTIVSPDYIPLSILDSNGNLSEIVYLTAYTAAATTGTITRGQEGTTGVAQSSGNKVLHAPTRLDITIPSIPLGADDLSTGWTWQNQGSVVRTPAPGGYSDSLYSPYNGAAFPWALRLKSTALTSAINLTAKMRLVGGSLGSYCFSGIVLRNSTNGNFINHGIELSTGGASGTGGYWITHWNGTTYNAGGSQLQRRYAEYLRMRTASGTLYCDISPDGISWANLYSETLSGYLGAYDQIGYGLAQGVNPADAVLALDWIKAD